MSSAVGLYGVGETNEAGEQLEDVCLKQELALANTMFKQHVRIRRHCFELYGQVKLRRMSRLLLQQPH